MDGCGIKTSFISAESLTASSGRFPHELAALWRSVKQERKQVSSTIVFNNVLNCGLCTEATDITEVILVLGAPEGGAVVAACGARGQVVNGNAGRREL